MRFICFPSLRNHSPVLPEVQCLKFIVSNIFLQFLVFFMGEGKSDPCFSSCQKWKLFSDLLFIANILALHSKPLSASFLLSLPYSLHTFSLTGPVLLPLPHPRFMPFVPLSLLLPSQFLLVSVSPFSWSAQVPPPCCFPPM